MNRPFIVLLLLVYAGIAIVSMAPPEWPPCPPNAVCDLNYKNIKIYYAGGIKSTLLWDDVTIPSDDHCAEDAVFQRDYAAMNILYFGKRLPETVSVCWDDTIGKVNVLGLVGKLKSGVFRIHIASELKPLGTQYLITLAHEMCHVFLWDVENGDMHGTAFQAQMRVLANKGAFDEVW